MVSLDLIDAYLHMPIPPSHWWYLQFALRNAEGGLIVYQLQVLNFGFTTSHRVFTKHQGPVVAHLHLKGCLPGVLHSPPQPPQSPHSEVYCQPHKVVPCFGSDYASLGTNDRQHQGGGISIPSLLCTQP